MRPARGGKARGGKARGGKDSGAKAVLRRRRHARVRKKVTGTPMRPRLAVFRSNRHIVAQVIDDIAGRTLAAASTTEASFRAEPASGAKRAPQAVTGNAAAARVVGRLVAERALEAGVTKVTFDRGGFKYHGRVAALAEAARESGLEF